MLILVISWVMSTSVPPLGPEPKQPLQEERKESAAAEIFKKILSASSPDLAAQEMGEDRIVELIQTAPREAEIFLAKLRPLNAATKKEVVEGISHGLRYLYIEEKKGEEMAALLEDHLRKGKYDRCISPMAFKRELLQDLRTVCSDPHLDIEYSYQSHPQNSPWALLEGPSEQEIRKFEELDKEYAREKNFGIAQVEVIGKVGYLKIDLFCPASFKETEDTIDQAMQKIANTDALIIDLRDNNGGSPATVAMLASYLFDGKPFTINQTYDRYTHKTKSYVAHPENHPIRFGGTKPIYLLTSDKTFSAGEELVYDLKALGRSTKILGQKTKGGAHPTRMYVVNAHFHVNIPHQKARNPQTGTNWEGMGIAPDQELSKEEDAKAVALKLITA